MVLKPTTDACTSLVGGGGGFMVLNAVYHCFALAWSPAERALIPAEYGTDDWARLHATEGEKPLWIQRLEFYIMCVGVVVFAPLLKDMDVCIELVGDNLGSVQILNRERSRRDPVIAIMHRWLTLFAAEHKIEIKWPRPLRSGRSCWTHSSALGCSNKALDAELLLDRHAVVRALHDERRTPNFVYLHAPRGGGGLVHLQLHRVAGQRWTGL